MIKDDEKLNNNLKKENNDMCVKGSIALGILFFLLGFMLACTVIFCLVNNKPIISSIILGGMALMFFYLAIDSFKKFEVVDNKILYTMLFIKKEIEITDSIEMKCEMNLHPNEYKHNGTVTIYNGGSKFCTFGNLGNYTIKEFIEIARRCMIKISTNNGKIESTLNISIDSKEIDSWIDKCEKEIENEVLDNNADIRITDSELGNIDFYKDENGDENMAVCEKFKFGKYNPEIIIPDEFYEEDIPLYTKTIKKVYEMRKNIINALLSETLSLCRGKTDKDNNEITIEYVKEYFDIVAIYILSYEEEDSDKNTSEIIAFQAIGFISDNRGDNDLLLGGHSIIASVDNSSNYEIKCDLEG